MTKNQIAYLFSITLLICFLFASCKSQEEVEVNSALSVDANAIKKIDVEKDDFTEFVDEQIDSVTVEIIGATQNRTIQRAAIEMKKFFNKRLHKYENNEDIRKAFLNSWSFIYRFKEYILRGEGKTLFGDQQQRVVAVIEAILSHFNETAEKHLNKRQLKSIQNDLKKFASENPIRGYYQTTTEISSNFFTNFLSIPLAPFKAVGTFNKGGESIAEISKTVARFTDIAEDLPDEIRWQLQVLAVQLQQNDILKTNTDSFQKLAHTSEQLVTIVDQYPDKVSEKVKKAAKDLEKTITQLTALSKQIDASMTKLQTSSDNFQKFGTDINQSTEKIAASLQQVEASSKALTKAAEAVSLAMKDIKDFTVYINETSDDSPDDKNEDSFLVEVEKASNALAKSASEITTTLDKVIELSKGKPFNEELNVIDQKAQKTLVMTREESQTLIDYAFKKAIILISLIFVFSFIFIIAKSRISKQA